MEQHKLVQHLRYQHDYFLEALIFNNGSHTFIWIIAWFKNIVNYYIKLFLRWRQGKRARSSYKITLQWLQQLELQFHQALQCQSSKCIFPKQVTIPQRFMCTHGNRLVGERSFPPHFYDKTNKCSHISLSVALVYFFLGGGDFFLQSQQCVKLYVIFFHSSKSN